jgi:hypothetical protein
MSLPQGSRWLRYLGLPVRAVGHVPPRQRTHERTRRDTARTRIPHLHVFGGRKKGTGRRVARGDARGCCWGHRGWRRWSGRRGTGADQVPAVHDGDVAVVVRPNIHSGRAVSRSYPASPSVPVPNRLSSIGRSGHGVAPSAGGKSECDLSAASVGVEPGGLARQVVALGEVGCLVGRLGVQPCRRRQVAVALVEVGRHRGVAGQ